MFELVLVIGAGAAGLYVGHFLGWKHGQVDMMNRIPGVRELVNYYHSEEGR